MRYPGFAAILAAAVLALGCIGSPGGLGEYSWPAAGNTSDDSSKKRIQQLTLKESFAKLTQMSATGDLQFYAYNAFNLGEDGKTYDYTISGYSPARDVVVYVSANPNSVKLLQNKNPNEKRATVERLESLKDSSDFVTQALKDKGPCAKSLSIIIPPVRGKFAEVVCTQPQWSIEVEPTK